MAEMQWKKFCADKKSRRQVNSVIRSALPDAVEKREPYNFPMTSRCLSD